jgi:uncharacterized protein
MESVGMVVGSAGASVDLLVQDEAVEVGSILEIDGHYGIVAGMRYSEDLKIGSKQRLIAKVQIFGKLAGDRLKLIKRPVKPSSRAKLASTAELEGILSDGDAISIGNIYSTDARARLKAGEYDRHIAILASTGAGKSYTCANLIKEYARLGLPIVIVDTHGEYSNLLAAISRNHDFTIKNYTVKFERQGYERLIIPLCGLEAGDFNHFLNLTEPQEAALNTIVEQLTGKDYAIADMILKCDELPEDKVHEATKQALSRKLSSLKRMGYGVFDKYGTDITRIACPYQVTIIDASMAAQGIRRSVISYLSKEILSGRINQVNELEGKKVEDELLFVVEEAHNFAGSNLTHSCKSQLQKIASEGRKFGVGLVVISQKPSKIDEEILSQCNSGIYMHITNPKDKDHIRRSFESISDEIISGLDALDVGECIIAGALLDLPFLLCQVDRIEVQDKKKKKFNYKKPAPEKTGKFGYV